MKAPENEPKDPIPAKSQANPAMPKELVKRIMRDTIGAVQKMGKGAAGLVARLRKTENLQEMEGVLIEHQQANDAERKRVAGRLESLHREIGQKKQAFAKAAVARKRILEMELRNLLSQHKAAERTYQILLDNERALSLVTGRLQELNAYSLSGVDESLVDRIADEIEDKSLEADLKADSVDDLEKAGRRRERGMDSEDLWAELEGFEEGEPDQPGEGAKEGEAKEREKRREQPDRLDSTIGEPFEE